MTCTVEDVKSMIRARIDDKREQEAYEASQSARKQGGAELRALRHWSDIHLHNQVLRRLLNDIDAKANNESAHLYAKRDALAKLQRLDYQGSGCPGYPIDELPNEAGGA